MPTRPILIATLLLFQIFVVAFVVESAERKPNIVVILVDDMGYGDPGCFNSKSKIPTPHIDSLARDGMRLTDAHAPGPLCHMSRYGLMTGRYPFRINVNRWPTEPLIKAGETTIASLAKTAGYRTAMVGKWHVGFRERGYENSLLGGPVDCGFDSFFGIRASTDIPPYFYIRDRNAVMPPTDRIEANSSDGWSPIQGEFWRAGGIAPDLKLAEVLPRFADEACGVIKGHEGSDDPLMLYVAFPAPHTPWLPEETYLGKSGAGMYGDFAMMVDAMIGRILDQIRASEMEQETMVIFSSDNGPVWYDEDVARFGHDSSGGLRGMKADAWECGHRMPMIIRWPGVVEKGGTSDRLVCFTDLLATFDELFDTDAIPGDSSRSIAPDSFSFLNELTGSDRSKYPRRQSLAMKSGRGLMVMRSGEWKLIDGDGSGGFSDGRGKDRRKQPSGRAKGQLYNLRDDLGETNNLIDEEPKIAEQLRSDLQTILDSTASRP